MKNENVHMQALHCDLDIVLVQILPCLVVQKQITAFARIRLPAAGLHLYLDAGFTLRPL